MKGVGLKISWRRIALLVVAGVFLLWGAKVSYSLIKWKAYLWAPHYVSSLIFDQKGDRVIPDSQRHLLFLMCDHYEPGFGDEGVRRNLKWLAKFRPISEKHRDSAGNRFQYTWFYAYDHKNEPVLKALAEMTRDGYGEVEFHWHHPPADNQTFPPMLEEAVAWFQTHGLLMTSGEKPETRFAFIHGNWALDGSQARCGVTRELAILFRHGCYADFTFSTIGTASQPRRVNSIYYAQETDEPKSYDDGIPAAVGQKISDRFMIFQGPSSISWTGDLEYGAVESDPLPSRKRINAWMDANIHVRGRPEWMFIKVFSHGIQSERDILDKHLTLMLSHIENICKERQISLHYVTAREAYNIVKAAEDGMEGNPELYRNYRIPPPLVKAKSKEK